jgi:cytochrome c peroxidase
MKTETIILRITFFAVWIVASVGCGGTDQASARKAKPIGAVLELKAPLGLPPVPIPSDNPVTPETVALGRKLFYDKRLSKNDSLSCASCHNPLLGFADGRPQSPGAGGTMGTRNAPSLLNAAYARTQFWDGRAPTLEEQVGGPMANPIEMNQPHEVAVSKLNADTAMRKQFELAFGPGPVTIGKIEKALASFERTVVSGNSPFDRYQFSGDKQALTPAAIRGLAVFEQPQKGNCVTCHTIGKKYALFTDGQFHNIGVGVNEEGELTDLGRYTESKVDTDKGAFKTPTLRNIAQSAPYMHNGSLKTLKDVVDFYAGGGNSNPYLDRNIKMIKLSGQDRLDLIEFLKSLTGEMPQQVGPPDTGH